MEENLTKTILKYKNDIIRYFGDYEFKEFDEISITAKDVNYCKELKKNF